MTVERRAGHRLLPHTADLILEAWAPTRIECLEEAARALVDSFARVPTDLGGRARPIRLLPGDDDATLVALLEEVMFVVDALESVPIAVSLADAEDEGIRGELELVSIDTVEIHGPAPKGVSFGDLAFERDDGGWRCRATIDV
jgi:SHS2 domain-containing protein